MAIGPLQGGSDIDSSGRALAISLGIVCAVMALTLWGLSRSKWGKNKPLTNCVVLAVIAHVWLLMYAYGTRVVSFGPPGGMGPGQSSMISVTEWIDVPTEPFESMPDMISDPAPGEVIAPPLLAVQPDTTENENHSLEHSPESFASETSNSDLDIDSPEFIEELLPTKQEPANALDSIVEQNIESDIVLLKGNQSSPELSKEPAIETVSKDIAQAIPASSKAIPRQRVDQQPMPESYQLRFSSSRLAIAQQFGGDESTEASVEAALRWLSTNQEIDGSWNASKHGGGRETQTMERNRAGTGGKADTAMTGLALLAFLGAGYTHAEGTYASTIEAGLQFLMRSQMPSGDLAGLKQIGGTSDVYYARMYSHGMSALALAEAYAITGDNRLVEPIQKALTYTLQAQNRVTGGWRYQNASSDDPGDTSQFGWQAMALLSSQNGGFTLPAGHSQLLHGYLSRVSVGRFGGLAVYRPIPGQQPTHAMTAEALAMRLMLKHPISSDAISEAKGYLMQQLPGSGEENLYYWYYASIALFQLQDDAWTVWNEAMKPRLLGSQVRIGPQIGSWNPTCIWAGYGGRVYSTSMACLCLEVYYRYLPIYQTPSFASTSQSAQRR